MIAAARVAAAIEVLADVMLILGGTRQRLLKMFRSVEPVGRIDIPFGLPEESGQTLWLCRDALEPVQQAWPRLRTSGDGFSVRNSRPHTPSIYSGIIYIVVDLCYFSCITLVW